MCICPFTSFASFVVAFGFPPLVLGNPREEVREKHLNWWHFLFSPSLPKQCSLIHIRLLPYTTIPLLSFPRGPNPNNIDSPSPCLCLKSPTAAQHHEDMGRGTNQCCLDSVHTVASAFLAFWLGAEYQFLFSCKFIFCRLETKTTVSVQAVRETA